MDMYFNGKKATALNIFKYILKKSPTNENALKYSQLVLNEKYDDQVKGLFDEANKLYDSQKYSEARLVYEKIYKINPNIPTIKEKIDQCTLASSEQKRQQAIQSQTAGQYFQSITYYLESLKILSSNSNAKQGLELLRKKMSETIPQMMSDGLLFYNHRKYKDAISIFKNILLFSSLLIYFIFFSSFIFRLIKSILSLPILKKYLLFIIVTLLLYLTIIYAEFKLQMQLLG
jgi:tetratricopeptide (TPR) repeat protein